MIMGRVKTLFQNLWLGVAALLLLHAGTAPAEEVIRWQSCLDPRSGAITIVQPGACQGQVISAEEAEAIRAERVARNRQALIGTTPPVGPGLRQVGSGTGFFVAPDGLLLTNYHVVQNCNSFSVESATGASVRARLEGAAPDYDLALLRSEMKSPAVATVRPVTQFDGQTVAVLGYPDRGMVPLYPLFVLGQLEGHFDSHDQIFTFRGDVRPGNSGGPLFDASGAVLGVIFAKIDSVREYQKSGTLVRDVGYAISIPVVQNVLQRFGLHLETAPAFQNLDASRLEQQSKMIIARVNCWQ